MTGMATSLSPVNTSPVMMAMMAVGPMVTSLVLEWRDGHMGMLAG